MLILITFTSNAQDIAKIKNKNIRILKVLKNPESRGCSSFKIYQKIESIDKFDTYVVISVVRDKIELDENFKKFNIKNNQFIRTNIEVLNQVNGDNNYCTDAIRGQVKGLKQLKLIKGVIEIRIVKEDGKVFFDGIPYFVEFILKDAIFEDNSNKYKIEEIHWHEVYVNYIMG
jgi:hypothetical protein